MSVSGPSSSVPPHPLRSPATSISSNNVSVNAATTPINTAMPYPTSRNTEMVPMPPPRPSNSSISSKPLTSLQANGHNSNNLNPSAGSSLSSKKMSTASHLDPIHYLSLPLSSNYDAASVLELTKEEQQSISDEFLAHQRLFGFQSSNVRNQYEHLCFLIQNARDRYGRQAYSYLHTRLFSNYRRWVNHINAQRWCFQKRIRHHFTDKRYEDKNKLQDLVLWLLIWGEAANCRHMPEFLCFIFFRMSQQRSKVIEARQLPADHSGDEWYRRYVIEPAYNIVAAMMQYQRNNGSLKDHINRPHYDDINEYFWNRRWLDHGVTYGADDEQHFWGKKFLKGAIEVDKKTGLPMIPQKEGSDRERDVKDDRRRGLKTFIEKRTWLVLWRSFDRIVQLHLFALHILIVFAYGWEGDWNILCSSVLTLAGLDFLVELLEVYFYWGLIFHLGMFINLTLRILVKGAIFVVMFYLLYISWDYWKWVALGYFGLRLLFELINLQTHRWLRKWHLSEDRNFESRVAPQIGCRYILQLFFWIFVFGAKCVVSYFAYIMPLINITTTLLNGSVDGWAGRDGIARQGGTPTSNILLVIALWVPTLTIYFIDTQIFYSVFIVPLGIILGLRDGVSNVRSWEEIQHKWTWSWRRGAMKFFGRDAMGAIQIATTSHVGGNNALGLPALALPPWHLIHVLWKNIVEEMRSSDMISYHDEQLLHFGHFQLITRSTAVQPQPLGKDGQPLPLPPRPAKVQNFYFLPAFVTSGQITTLISITGACEESKHNKASAAKLVIQQMRSALLKNESMRTALDEFYVATSLLLRIFIQDCNFDPATQGNKLLDYAARQPLPHTFLSGVLKQVNATINECIAICFDMGYQNIVRKRPSAESDSTEEGWMDRAEQVNTKNLNNLMSALYKTWRAIEMNTPAETAAQGPAPTVLVNHLDEIENNGASTLLRVLYHLTSTASVDARPHNAVVTDRLQFFLSSLNTAMPNRQNSIREMYSWTVLTPYVDELVIYTEDDIQSANDDGVTQEFYLQCLYRKEWLNWLERMEVDPRGHDPSYRLLQKREWCSYRGQTLLRTVRGMMFYEKAVKILALLEMAPEANGLGSPQQIAAAQNIARRKFQYVLSCQRYGQFMVAREKRDRGELVDRKQLPDLVRKERKKLMDEAQKCDDIEYILRKWPHLRVAYVDDKMEDGVKVFSSVLVKAEELKPDENNPVMFNDEAGGEYGIGGDIVEIYRVRLPGSILIGEGKPENQNHALIFTRGEFTEQIDMNQDNYFEEALKMRNLLEEFDPHRVEDRRGNDVRRPNPVTKSSQSGILQCAILGFREHIFTANLMSVGTYMSLIEHTFVSITLRSFAFFGSRMHYGHPDLLDKLFFMTRGGVSKSSKMLHVSEDIFAGFKSTLRGGRIDHREYIQCGKGRDLGFGQLFLFEAKLASGAGEQALSREAYRMGRYLDLPRLLSFFYGSIGFYATTTLMVLAIIGMLFARVLLSLTNLDSQIFAYDAFNGVSLGLLQGTSIFQLGLLLTVSMLAEIALEAGIVKSCTTLAWMLVTGSPLFFFFHMATKAFFFNNSVLYGGAKYRATGRGFVLSRDSFCRIYRNYARTHVYPAMKLLWLIVVFGIFYNTSSFIEATWSCILLVVAWLFAPVWYNPLAFDHEKVIRDFNEWKRWLTRISPNEEDSWQAWWVSEHDFIKRIPSGTRHLNVFLNLLIPIIIIVCCVANVGTDDLGHIVFLIVSFGGCVGCVLLFTFVLHVCKPIGDTWRYMKLIIFALIIGFAVVSIVLQPSATTSRFRNFCVFLISVTLTFNAMCKILVYYGAGPFHFSFVVHWFRWTDGLFGLIIYIPWLIISFFDFFASVQTRLLYNNAFSKGLQIQTILHGRGASAATLSRKTGKKLDADGNIVYARASSRYGRDDDWEGTITPADWERQQLIGRRSRTGLPSADRPSSGASSGGVSPHREPDYPPLKGGHGPRSQYPQYPGTFAEPPESTVASTRRGSSTYINPDMSPSSQVRPPPTTGRVRGVVYGPDGRVLQRYQSEGDNTMRRQMAAAMAAEEAEADQGGLAGSRSGNRGSASGLGHRGSRVAGAGGAGDDHSYAFSVGGAGGDHGIEEVKTDPVALVYNPISPGTALHLQQRQAEAAALAREEENEEVRQAMRGAVMQNRQHVELDEDVASTPSVHRYPLREEDQKQMKP